MPNHLAQETSPYLKQHADNPVNWFPWGEEALALARSQNKPILLSVGYSACHWCHVMAHESFEDEQVAQAMNRHFINIKVDREERPDLDQIYQTAHYMLTERGGGWPLTMFLTPDQKPFYGGTYFPKETRYNLPGFKELLGRVAEFYHKHGAEIEQQHTRLLEAFSRTLPASPTASGEFSDAPLTLGFSLLKSNFDLTHGGFGGAPKFPHPFETEFCLRTHAATGNSDALHMARLTLEKMAQGGIYDQLGGGFCRYSVDQHWMIPHFEKMLYDNGPLLKLYCDAFLATGSALFKRVVEETAQWVMREMQSPDGGYYSTLDADSEHQEGKFYVWTPEQAAALLTNQEYQVAAPHYGLDRPANFEGEHWHLNVVTGIDEIALRQGLPLKRAGELLESARKKLFASREARVHPGRDEKILTSWNALMIKGMARAARVFNREDWLDSARRAAGFIRATMWKDNRLFATYKDGTAHLNAYLDDYAFLLDALLEFMQARFNKEDFSFAVALAEVLLERFEDPEEGGFFFTSHDHEKLIHRPKSGHDNATPSGNGVAAFALQRLGHVAGDSRYIDAAERALRLFYPLMQRQAGGFASLAAALEESLTPPQIVILRGKLEAMEDWQRALPQEYSPRTLAFAIEDTAGLPPSLDKPVIGAVNAWVCQGVKCLPVIENLEVLLQVCKSGKVV